VKTFICVKTCFEGWHNWPEAPIEIEFLRFPHRHLFYVEVKLPVLHDDRQLEFFIVKRFLDETIKMLYPSKVLKQRSCEMMAKELLEEIVKKFKIKRGITISISEDNENGAIVEI
jgi:hypothetical protein